MTHRFQMNINCTNAAFCEDDSPTQQTAGPEIVRILRIVANRIESGETFDYHRNIHDVNGNIVGTFSFKNEGV